MTQREALEALLEKVKAGEAFRIDAPQRKNRTAEYECLGGYYQDSMAYGAFHGSLDAAKALHDAVLPGWGWRVGIGNVLLYRLGGEGRHEQSTGFHSPARAWLIAIIQALIAMEGET